LSNIYFGFVEQQRYDYFGDFPNKKPRRRNVRVSLAFRLRIHLSMRDFTGDYCFLRFPLPFEKYLSVTVN